MNKQKLINIALICAILIIIIFGIVNHYNMQNTINKLSAEINDINTNAELSKQINSPERLESDIDYSVYLESANSLNQNLANLENELALIDYNKTISKSEAEEKEYVTKYLDMSSKIKDLFLDDNSKFIAATLFYTGAFDKAKYSWNFVKSYDFTTQTIPVILLCYSNAHDSKELVSYAMMDYSIKDDKFMNLKVFETYYGHQYILGTGITVDSEATQGMLTPEERAVINRGDSVNTILDYVHQWDLDHPNGIDNPELDEAIKIKLKENGIE